MRGDLFEKDDNLGPATEKQDAATVAVLVPLPSETAYTYRLPEGDEAVPGTIVQVPLGPRLVPGIVWDSPTDPVPAKKLRPVERVFDCPPLVDDMRAFIDWVARYTMTPPGLVARMVLRVPAAFEPEAPMTGLRATGFTPKRMTEPRARVLALLADGEAWTKTGLVAASGVSAAVIDGLIRSGAIERVDVPPLPVVPPPDLDHAVPTLSDAQKEAADTIAAAFADTAPRPILLDGVTGAGKTEVYLEAIAALLAEEPDAQILVLLPEIALTDQVLSRFEDRFGARPAQWHSGLTPRQRERVWRQVADGSVRVVAGARSALFLPFRRLRFLVVDEEHETAYKQEEGATYHARDMAVVRAAIGRFPVVLASATPSLETRINAEQDKYRWLRLPKRYGAAALPDIRRIDLRKAPPPRGKFLSPDLVSAVGETLARKEQALLFLNRRGYAPLTLCRACGHRFECPSCSAWLVEHRFRGRLQCHHCGHAEPVPEACPACGTFDHLTACGPGVERIAEEAAETFPDARILVLSSDLMGGVKRLRVELDAIARGDVDLVIGTQLVAKGHNFPLLSCVGVVDGDIGLSNADPRAAERTFQMIAQVTGRAGRSGLKSVGLIQTFLPEHPVMQALASGDSERFYIHETAEREHGGLPPFRRLAALIVSGEDREATEAHAKALRRAASQDDTIHVLGPAEAPLALIRGRYRFRLLFNAARRADLQGYLRALLDAAPRPRGTIRVHVDIDPQSFL